MREVQVLITVNPFPPPKRGRLRPNCRSRMARLWRWEVCNKYPLLERKISMPCLEKFLSSVKHCFPPRQKLTNPPNFLFLCEQGSLAKKPETISYNLRKWTKCFKRIMFQGLNLQFQEIAPRVISLNLGILFLPTSLHLKTSHLSCPDCRLS